MLIESRIRRIRYPLRPDGSGRDTVVGSSISMFGVIYRFHPQPKLTKGDAEAHVCEIKDPRIVDLLLDIPEGFNEYGKPPRVKVAREAPGQLPVQEQMEDLDSFSDDELALADRPAAIPED